MHDNQAFEINLMISAMNGGIYVRSPDVPGLHLCGTNMRAMKETVETAIKRLFKDNRGVNVNVIWVNNVSAIKRKKTSSLPEKLAVYRAE